MSDTQNDGQTPTAGDATPEKKPKKAKTAKTKKQGDTKKVKDLKKKLEAAEAELANLETQAINAQKQLLYERAELENYKRRMEKRRLDDLTFATERIVKELLPVIDNFDRALDHAGEGDAADDGFLTGIRQIAAQLSEALEAHGLKAEDPMGEKFDPNVHEAVAMVPGEGDNTIMAVQEKGYSLKDRLLRPAKVVVSTLAS